jgi:hypothetical protein
MEPNQGNKGGCSVSVNNFWLAYEYEGDTFIGPYPMPECLTAASFYEFSPNATAWLHTSKQLSCSQFAGHQFYD